MTGKPENVYVLLVVRRTGADIDPKSATDVYRITIPKATPAKDRGAEALTRVKAAVEKWLSMTSPGRDAWKATGGRFDWNNVSRYVPSDWLRGQCVMPYGPGDDLTWISDVVCETVLGNDIFDGAVPSD